MWLDRTQVHLIGYLSVDAFTSIHTKKKILNQFLFPLSMKFKRLKINIYFMDFQSQFLQINDINALQINLEI